MARMSLVARVLLGVSVIAAAGAGVRGQEPPVERGWIGLYTPALAGSLENANRLDELCPQRAHSLEWHACRDETLAPRVLHIPVREAPSAGAPVSGSIVVVALPGVRVSALAVSGPAGEGEPFVPDETDVDWGYGPHFHQTFLERRGTWFRLPPRPFPRDVWVDVSEWGGAGVGFPDVRGVEPGRIYESPHGDVFVVRVEPGGLVVRPEQEADMWCRAGDPPPPAPAPQRRLTWRELSDADGHLTLHLKYKRGC